MYSSNICEERVLTSYNWACFSGLQVYYDLKFIYSSCSVLSSIVNFSLTNCAQGDVKQNLILKVSSSL